MNKKIIYGFLLVAFAVVGCKSGENKDGVVVPEQSVSVAKDSVVAVEKTEASVEMVDSTKLTDNADKKSYEKVIVDTLIDGVKFKRYYFDIRTDELADETMLVLPVDGNAAANKKIIDRLLDDYSFDSDSIQQQLEAQFDAYASGNFAEEGDDYHESELLVYPLAVVEKKYVSYMLHSSLFWPSEQNHPQWADVYFMFDLNTGEMILQDDIFDASAENRQAVGVKIHDELVKFCRSRSRVTQC